MAQKSRFKLLKDKMSSVSNEFSTTVFSKINHELKILLSNLEKRVILIEDRIIGNLLNLVLISLGFILLIIATAFYLIEYLGFSRTLVFFIFGIIILLIGLLRKYSTKH